ncbi:hypothetical protein RCG17_06710 [Neobacillus sp. PS3-12]|uniref:hypothetical protein n=1 Tax=Neobacillus sp. PS3-12 TaxID=3070677 RepID=UPI0027E0358B|nr:hypothetical protein [Neobacillus sp. PS3-12]WML54332.1 hypothetical protein RCG17_06710 [Neobacillus sp. PS3-12]
MENRPNKEDHPRWKGGEAQLKSYIRNYLKDWKEESLLYYGGKCVITGETEVLDIHHLYSFDLLFRDVLEELNFPYYNTIRDYTSGQLKLLVDRCKKAHRKYPIGVPLAKKVHLYFHSLYPKETVPEHFYQFAQKHYNVNLDFLGFPEEHIPKRRRESLTDEDAVQAWKRAEAGESCRQIAKDYGVSCSTIENLANSKTYKHLHLGSLDLSPSLSNEQIMEIRLELKKGMTGVVLAKRYNVSTILISAIRTGSSGNPNSRFKYLPPLDIGWRKGKLSREEILAIRERAKVESPSLIAFRIRDKSPIGL